MSRTLALSILIAGFTLAGAGCAARGRIATPDEMARLTATDGFSAAGQIALAGPGGRFRTRVVIGVARPDALRIEIPSGSGLRFLLVTNGGKLRADLPPDDAMYEGPATSAVMDALFGVAFDPRDLVAALLGDAPPGIVTTWRFNRGQPARVSMKDGRGRELTLSVDESELQAPNARAFLFGPARRHTTSLTEMAETLGLKR